MESKDNKTGGLPENLGADSSTQPPVGTPAPTGTSAVKPDKLHDMLGIAALLTILVRNASSETQGFASFEEQMDQTLKLARSLKPANVAPGNKFSRFETIADEVSTFYLASDENKALFTRAHEAIRDLLVELDKLPGSAIWGPCAHVTHKTLRDLLSLSA